MATAAEWRRKAAEYDRLREEATRAGDTAEAMVMDKAYDTALRIAELMEEAEAAGRSLPADAQHGKQIGKLVAAERLRVSKGRAGGTPDPLVKAANDAGYTLRSLVEKLREEGYRVSHPYLRQCRTGTSRIRATLARRIEALTGFRATKASWPGGWAREPSEER